MFLDSGKQNGLIFKDYTTFEKNIWAQNNILSQGNVYGSSMNIWTSTPTLPENQGASQIGFGFRINTKDQLELVKFAQMDDNTKIMKRLAIFGSSNVNTGAANDVSYLVFDELSGISMSNPSITGTSFPSNTLSASNLSLLGTTTVHGDIIPNADVTYNLGSPNSRFKDLYLSGSTVYIGDSKLQFQNNSFQIKDLDDNFIPFDKDQLSELDASKITGTLTSSQIASLNSSQIVGKLLASQIDNVTTAQITGELDRLQVPALSNLRGTISSVQMPSNANLLGNTTMGQPLSNIVLPPTTAVELFTSNQVTLSNQAYGNGTYSINTSSELAGREAYRVLNSLGVWQSAPFTFLKSNSFYSGSSFVDSELSAYKGEWVQVNLPEEIQLSSYAFRSSVGAARSPRSWKVFGRSDNKWNLLDDRVEENLTLANTDYTFTISTQSRFCNKIAFVCNQIMHSTLSSTGTSYFSIAYLRLNGKLTSSVASVNGSIQMQGEVFAPAATIKGLTCDNLMSSAGRTSNIKVLTGMSITGDVLVSGTMTANTPNFANVKLFGAKGDGTTDDSSAISDALIYLNSIGGGILFFPSGTYITTNVNIIYSNIHIHGSSKGSTILKRQPNGGSHVLNFGQGTQIYNCSVQHLTIEGNRGQGTGSGHGIRFERVVNMTVDDIVVQNTTGYGLGFQDSSDPAALYEKHNIRISNILVKNIGDDAIDFKNRADNSHNVSLHNISIENWNVNNTGILNAIDIRGRGFRLSNIFIKFGPGQRGNGISLRWGNPGSVNGIGGHSAIISDFYVEGTSGSSQRGISNVARNVSFSNGIITNCEMGMLVYDEDCSISNVQFLECTTGIQTTTRVESDPLSVDPTTKGEFLNVNGCLFASDSNLANTTAIDLNQEYANVNNCVIKDHSVGIKTNSNANILHANNMFYNTLSNLA